MATTAVFSGGPIPRSALSAALASCLGDLGQLPDTVIAADSGLEACFAAGLEPDVVVGDMDSVDPAVLARAAELGARIDRHPSDKDTVDLELALDAAIELVPAGRLDDRLLVIGSAAGRIDHLVASIQLLGSNRFDHFEITAALGHQRVMPVHRSRSFTEPVGTTVSLLALHGVGTRVTTTGLRWRLHDHEIRPTSSLGISNRFSEVTACVSATGPPVTVMFSDELPGRDHPSPDARQSSPMKSAPGGGAP